MCKAVCGNFVWLCLLFFCVITSTLKWHSDLRSRMVVRHVYIRPLSTAVSPCNEKHKPFSWTCSCSVCRSAFFCFCNDERPKVKAAHPSMAVGDIAKELGKRWEVCTNKAKYEALAAKDKARYEQVTLCFHRSSLSLQFLASE